MFNLTVEEVKESFQCWNDGVDVTWRIGDALEDLLIGRTFLEKATTFNFGKIQKGKYYGRSLIVEKHECQPLYYVIIDKPRIYMDRNGEFVGEYVVWPFEEAISKVEEWIKNNDTI